VAVINGKTEAVISSLDKARENGDITLKSGLALNAFSDQKVVTTASGSQDKKGNADDNAAGGAGANADAASGGEDNTTTVAEEPVEEQAPAQNTWTIGGKDYIFHISATTGGQYHYAGDGKLELKGDRIVLQQGVKHVLTHQVLLADFTLWQPEERPQLPPDYIWVDEASLDDYAVPRLVERLYETVALVQQTK
jgi:hypothetical protein